MTVPRRHLFLTIWLSFIVIVNLIAAGMYFLMHDKITAALPTLPVWYTIVFGLFCILNVIYAIALFKWKKWGFYGFCILAIISSVLDVYFKVSGIIPAIIVPIISILMLYWALNVGKENKAWTKLT